MNRNWATVAGKTTVAVGSLIVTVHATVLLCVTLAAVLLLYIVIWAAVFSGKQFRRDAAYAVLSLFAGLLRPPESR